MWGGSLYDTHILHQSQFHTGPQGVGFRRHIYILEFVNNGSCGVGGCMMTFYSIGGHRGFEVWWGMYVPEGAHYTQQHFLPYNGVVLQAHRLVHAVQVQAFHQA